MGPGTATSCLFQPCPRDYLQGAKVNRNSELGIKHAVDVEIGGGVHWGNSLVVRPLTWIKHRVHTCRSTSWKTDKTTLRLNRFRYTHYV